MLRHSSRSPSFHCYCPSKPSAKLWHGVDGDEAFAWLGLGVAVFWLQGVFWAPAQKFGLHLWCCLCKCRPWLLLPPTDHRPGLLVIHVWPYHIPFWDQLALYPVPWQGLSGAGMSAQLGLGRKARGQLLVQSSPALPAGKWAPVYSSQVESRLLRIFHLSQLSPQQPRGLVSSMWGPGTGMPSVQFPVHQ